MVPILVPAATNAQQAADTLSAFTGHILAVIANWHKAKASHTVTHSAMLQCIVTRL